MTPILPREMLWTDLENMDEFFELEPVNEHFFEVFTTLREEPFAVKADAVKVFNELYYQITRMVYEHPMPIDLEKYLTDIKANLGWNYSAELVMTMTYFLWALIEKKQRPMNKFFMRSIYTRFNGCLYWKPIKHCFERLRKKKEFAQYRFSPRPVWVMWFMDKYILWRDITQNYDIGCIIKVLNLWENRLDKAVIAKKIKESIPLDYIPFKGEDDYDSINLVLDKYIEDSKNTYMMCAEPLLYEYTQSSRIEEQEKEKKALKSRIAELEAENERLKALLEQRKKKGAARKFTLVEIVDYCKDCVTWDDVKSIVAMLNKLLRRQSTKEDSDLVDSIETEFKQRLGVGIRVEQATIGVNSPGNYIANQINK